YDGRAGPPLDLTQAVPGYPPPPELLARLAEAAGSAACAGYGPIAGDTALREALAAEMSGFYGARIGAAEVAITAGCNLAFAMALSVLAAEGDAVLLPTPWYFNHHMAMTMQGVRAVPVPTRAEDGFVPDPALVARLLAEHRARAVVLVTPNNPTGAIHPAGVIHEIADLCRRHGAMLVLDETYRDFLPADRSPPHGLFGDPDWGDVLVHLYSFSKAYCVPGHRLGAVAAGPAVMEQMEKAFDTLQICPPRPAQAAIAWAIPALGAWRAGNRALMAGRAAVFRDAVAQLPEWRLDAIGTYFAYLRLPPGAPDAMRAAEILAAEHGLMTLPGPFFGPGQDRHLRLAFANAAEAALVMVPQRLSVLC
ncbi:aminotransferase, partial [Falsiroseomonas oryziterrae]|uniref:aminotransferase n=1 Tax=Falsiroseomonas oryziterrae TaxID=2911368 RepID=UPI001F00B911